MRNTPWPLFNERLDLAARALGRTRTSIREGAKARGVAWGAEWRRSGARRSVVVAVAAELGVLPDVFVGDLAVYARTLARLREQK